MKTLDISMKNILFGVYCSILSHILLERAVADYLSGIR
jgi:hypothetical protein